MVAVIESKEASGTKNVLRVSAFIDGFNLYHAIDDLHRNERRARLRSHAGGRHVLHKRAAVADMAGVNLHPPSPLNPPPAETPPARTLAAASRDTCQAAA